MISIGFQFDYELNSKNHPKKIIKHFGFFFRFFWFFCRFVFDFFVFFLIFLDCFFEFFWIFFDFNWIFFESLFFSIFSIFFDFFRFQLDFFGFQLDFFMSVGEATSLRKKKKTKKSKNIKNQIQNPFLFDFNWFNSKIQSNWNPKKSEKIEKIRGKIFFLPSS